MRFLAVAYAFVFIYYFTATKSPKYFPGKWSVALLIRNRDTVHANAWIKDSTAWKDVYFELFPRVTLNPNPYVIDATRAQSGSYEYDSTSHKIELVLWLNNNKRDT